MGIHFGARSTTLGYHVGTDGAFLSAHGNVRLSVLGAPGSAPVDPHEIGAGFELYALSDVGAPPQRIAKLDRFTGLAAAAERYRGKDFFALAPHVDLDDLDDLDDGERTIGVFLFTSRDRYRAYVDALTAHDKRDSQFSVSSNALLQLYNRTTDAPTTFDDWVTNGAVAYTAHDVDFEVWLTQGGLVDNPVATELVVVRKVLVVIAALLGIALVWLVRR